MKIVAICFALVAISIAAKGSAQETSESQIAPPGCDYGAPHPNAPEELAQFDFLIGDYSIATFLWDGEKWGEPLAEHPARWNGRYILGGMAIADEWFDADPGIDPDTTRGINIRMWDEKAEEWDMMWIHSAQNQTFDLRAKMSEGRLSMWNEAPSKPAYDAYFERLGPDSWARMAYRVEANGAHTPTIRMVATRIPCGIE